MLLIRATADTITLNDGKSFEGTVVYEDDKHLLFEVQVSEGIKDEKKILKADIKSHTKLTPDIGEYADLIKLAPAPDLLGVVDYEARIKKFDAFIKTHPRSTKLVEVRKLNDKLKEELEIVRAGGIKFSGNMISANDYLSNAYAYDEAITNQKINREINNRNLLGALRLFSDYETKFSEGSGRDELVPRIKQVLRVYKDKLSESIEGYDTRIKQREVGLTRMTDNDRAITVKALKDELDSLKQRLSREKLMKGAWVTPDENYKESMVEALRQADNEIKRLEMPPKNLTVLATSIEDAYRDAWAKLPGASVDDQKIILEGLKRDRMPVYYLEKLRERITPK